MPYQAGQRLSGESASKLGHLDVLNSELVNKVIQDFEQPDNDIEPNEKSDWREVDDTADPLQYTFAVDGSMQNLQSQSFPKRELAFVKTALLHLDPKTIARIDPEYPHPNSLRKVMENAALYHATVFPLKNIRIKDSPWLEGVRKLIRDSLKDNSLDGEPFETLKWILFQKWLTEEKHTSPAFDCPECTEEQPGFPYDQETMKCKKCSSELFVSDVLGLHMELSEDSAGESLSSAYMLIHEVLLLFTAIRYFWEKKNWKVLGDTLFLKDGPLTLRGQYSKIVPNIRNFLSYANTQGVTIHICGQEKTGKFVDYLQSISPFIKPQKADESAMYSILSHSFIRKEIQRVRESKYPYGFRTNYGEKVLVKQNSHHSVVLSITTGQYLDDEEKPNTNDDFFGIDRILTTLPSLLSYRHEGALVPIELVNGIASLSNYPSAKVLKLFSGID